MTRSDKWLLGTQAVSLALVLFIMWHVAGSAAHVS
jgi:hypothetical protein